MSHYPIPQPLCSSVPSVINNKKAMEFARTACQDAG